MDVSPPLDMANKNGIRRMDRKSMKQVKGGIIGVLMPAAGFSAQTEPMGGDLTVRKAGEKPLG